MGKYDHRVPPRAGKSRRAVTGSCLLWRGRPCRSLRAPGIYDDQQSPGRSVVSRVFREHPKCLSGSHGFVRTRHPECRNWSMNVFKVTGMRMPPSDRGVLRFCAKPSGSVACIWRRTPPQLVISGNGNGLKRRASQPGMVSLLKRCRGRWIRSVFYWLPWPAG